MAVISFDILGHQFGIGDGGIRHQKEIPGLQVILRETNLPTGLSFRHEHEIGNRFSMNGKWQTQLHLIVAE